jgi:hypothetical protein
MRRLGMTTPGISGNTEGWSMSGQRERELIGIIEKQILRMDALYASITDAFD